MSASNEIVSNNTTPVAEMVQTPVPVFTDLPASRQQGWVKWFDNKKGFGFAVVLTGDKKGSDIFVHNTSLKVHTTNTFRELTRGEFIEYTEGSCPEGSTHPFQATNVTGIMGYPLACDLRKMDYRPPQVDNDVRQHSSYQNTQRSAPPQRSRGGPVNRGSRGSGGRGGGGRGRDRNNISPRIRITSTFGPN